MRPKACVVAGVLASLWVGTAQASAAELLTDGGFEGTTCSVGSGCTNSSWVETASYPPAQFQRGAGGFCKASFSTCGVSQRSGDGLFHFGQAYNNGASINSYSHAGSLTQTVGIGPGPAQLTFYIRGNDLGGVGTVTLKVDGTQVYTNSTPSLSFSQVTIDLSAYANNADHVLRFGTWHLRAGRPS